MKSTILKNKFFTVALVGSIVFAGLTFGNLPGSLPSTGIQVVDGVTFNFADYPSLTHEQIAIFNYFDGFITDRPYNDLSGWQADRFLGFLHYMPAFTSYVFATMFETTPGYRTSQYENFAYTLIKQMNTSYAEYGNQSIEAYEWHRFQFRDYYYPDAENPDEDDVYTGGFRGPANIMWTGHYALMMTLYERNFNAGEMIDEITWFVNDWNRTLTTDGFNNSQAGGIWKIGMITCEPYIAFVQCNSIPLYTTVLYDNLYDTNYMENGTWDYYLNFIEANMTDEYGLYTDGYFVQKPIGLIPDPAGEPLEIPGLAKDQHGLPRLNSYGLAWALMFLEYTIPELTIPDYPLYLDLYGKEVSGDQMYMLGSYHNPTTFGDLYGMLGTLFTMPLANQREDYITRDRLLNFMQKPYNKVWSPDGRSMYYDTSPLEPFLAPNIGGFTVWSTVPVTMKDLAEPRPAEFWNYPFISAADDDNIWVYQAVWDPIKEAFILNVQVDETATFSFSNFADTPTAYSNGYSLGELLSFGDDYSLTLSPGVYNLVIK